MAYNQGSAEDYFGQNRKKMASQPDNGFFKGYDTNTGAAEGRANPKPKKQRPDSRSRENLSRNRKNLLRRQGR